MFPFMETAEHPLKAWMERKGLKTTWVAGKLQCTTTTLYAHFNGQSWPTMRLARDIETLTEGDVTIQDVRCWESGEVENSSPEPASASSEQISDDQRAT